MVRKLFLILFLFSFIYSFGQSLEFGIKKFSIEDGLSNNTVGEIIQDSTGFIWIRTEIGLNRFDGYSFKPYFNIPGDSTSIYSNDIRSVFVDSKQQFWVSTGVGTSKYNPVTDKFKRYIKVDARFNEIEVLLPDKNISSGILQSENGFYFFNFIKDRFKKIKIESKYHSEKSKYYSALNYDISKKILWYYAAYGLLYNYNFFNKKHNQYNLYKHKDKKVTREWYNVFITSRGTLAQTFNKIYRFEEKNNNFVEFEEVNNSLFSNLKLLNIIEDKSNNLWIGTDNGLFLLKGKNIFYYNSNHTNPKFKISNNYCNKLFEDSKGRIHLLTDNGYNVLNCFDEGFIQIKNTKFSQPLTGTKFQNISELKTGEIFLSSIYKGFNLITIKNRAIKKYYPNENKNSIKQASLYSIIENKEKNLYVITQDSGICFLDRKAEKWIDIENSPKNIIIPAEMMDNEGNLWIGLKGGELIKYDVTKKTFASFGGIIDGVNMKTAYVRTIFQVNKDTLYVGTRGKGIFMFDKKKNKYIKRVLFFEDPKFKYGNQILSIIKANENQIWIGTDYGLFKFDLITEKVIEHYSKGESSNCLSGNTIFSIYNDSYNQLWLGTYDGGLNLFLGKEKGFKSFGRDTEEKFTSVLAITEDRNRNIWFTTTNGIFRINPITHKIKKFTKKDGFLGNEFNTDAIKTLSTGEIAAGGIDGLNIFYPDSLKENKNIPKMAFTKFSVNNKEVKLIPDIAVSEEVDVDYDKKIITFEFAAFNYINTEENEYQYKLEGLSEKWNKIGNQHSVTFTNLEPNNYVLRVKGSNNDGYWNEKGISIKLSVIPPFWMTTWFYILVFVLAIIPVWVIYRLRIQRYKIVDETRSRIAENLHDEFGGKLSSIYFMSSLLLTKKDISDNKDVSNIVEKISEQSISIGDDFRDVVWSLNPENDNWETLLIKFKRFASDIFESKKIEYEISIPKLFVKKEIDTEKKLNYLLLIKEITNNIVKHSEAKNVSIKILLTKDTIKTVISDNGIGFDVNRVHEGNGIINIKKRIKILKAEYKLISNSENGTYWEIIIKY